MKSLEELSDILDSDYFENLCNIDTPASEYEIFAVSIKETWNITVKNAIDGSSYAYEVSNRLQSVVLVQIDDYFGICMDS
jgi:hypothetical protein